MFVFLFLIAISTPVFAQVEFDNIRNRQVAQYELAEMMVDLSSRDSLHLLDRWKSISPKSFRSLDFIKAYLLAGDRSLSQKNTNQALTLYVKAFQYLDKNDYDKATAAYRASLLLYAQSKRSEALFYINRAIEKTQSVKDHEFLSQITYLKRRIVWRYFSRLDFLPDNAISAIEFDGDDVWIGMWSGAIARFSRSSSELNLFNTKNARLPSHYVRDILVRPDKIWVATDNGLSTYDKVKGSWEILPFFNGKKLKIVMYDDGIYYVGTLFQGVFQSKDGITWTNIVPRQNVLDLIKVEDELYIGTAERGVYRYVNGVVTRILPDVSAKTMSLDPNQKFIWIGTYGQGLLKVDRTTGKVIETIDRAKLGSDFVESLMLVDDTLWIGTLEAGVVSHNIKKNTWSSLSLTEGLPGLDITVITRENEFLWFGTLAGGIGIFLFQEQHPVQEK